MSLKQCLALLALSLAFSANAQDAPPKSETAPDAVYRPPMMPVIQAFARTGRSKISTRAHIEYDASGRVLSATVDPSTGNRNLDNAIQAWVLGIQLKPGPAGNGWLPIEMSLK